MNNGRTTGKVYLIGAGPGDPKLLTLKAAEAIEESDAIVYDHLVNPEVLVHSRRGAELI
jgi:siroheme synthase